MNRLFVAGDAVVPRLPRCARRSAWEPGGAGAHTWGEFVRYGCCGRTSPSLFSSSFLLPPSLLSPPRSPPEHTPGHPVSPPPHRTTGLKGNCCVRCAASSRPGSACRQRCATRSAAGTARRTGTSPLSSSCCSHGAPLILPTLTLQRALTCTFSLLVSTMPSAAVMRMFANVCCGTKGGVVRWRRTDEVLLWADSGGGGGEEGRVARLVMYSYFSGSFYGVSWLSDVSVGYEHTVLISILFALAYARRGSRPFTGSRSSEYRHVFYVSCELRFNVVTTIPRTYQVTQGRED